MSTERLDEIGAVLLDKKLMGPPDTDRLYSDIEQLLKDGKKYIVIDLGKVDWISSMGVGTLVRGLSTIKNRGGEMYLLNLSDKAAHVLKVTQLARYFNICSTMEEIRNIVNDKKRT